MLIILLLSVVVAYNAYLLAYAWRTRWIDQRMRLVTGR